MQWIYKEIINRKCIENELERIKQPQVGCFFYKNISINADKAKIRQVLINVLNNSLKFTEKGSIAINLDIYQGKARIKITDTGIGIQKDKIQYLFNKFFTANDYGDATTGAGLGLNIVKTIIDMHEGTTIIITL